MTAPSTSPSLPEGAGSVKLTWQPIETAPKDGTEILVSGCSHGPRVRIAEWGSGRYLGRVKGYERGWRYLVGHTCDPTHWMPLPAPPPSPSPTHDSAPGGEDHDR